MPLERQSNEDRSFDSEHPGARFAADCALQLEVCKSLLMLADSLPENPDRAAMRLLADAVPLTWAAHLAFQTDFVFPLLKRRHADDEEVLDYIARLERQHIEVSGANDELIEQLAAVLRGEVVDPSLLGFVIRNAAERRREHVEWELLLLERLFPASLAPAERQSFLFWSSANPWPHAGINLGCKGD